MSSRQKHVVVITGAGGNLGHALARKLQELGEKLALIGHSENKLRTLYGDRFTERNQLILPNVDLTRAEYVEKAIERVMDHFSRIDVLINTVGGFKGGLPVHEEKLDTWESLLKVNLFITLHCCRAVIPHMVKRRIGRIVTVASRHAFQGPSNYAPYSVAKSAVLRLTESLAKELKPMGILVNCVVPGTIDTPQNRAAMPKADFFTWVAPDDVAEVILFLISDKNRAVTGAAVPVYGRG